MLSASIMAPQLSKKVAMHVSTTVIGVVHQKTDTKKEPATKMAKLIFKK